jgi:HD-like signal output (HDOD) protein
MFKKLFGLGAKKDEEKQTLLPEAIRKSILHSLGLKSVPIMPGAAQQAFMLATNPNAEAHDYIEVLEADEGLSARILKIANSVFYDRGGGSRTIADAVNVVGLAELKNLLNATALSNLFPVRHHLRASFWTHNIATALTARVLSRSVYPTGTDQAFLAGLMHDIGKLLMLQQHMDNYERVLRKGLSDGIDSVSAEVQVYPFAHTHVGQMLAERWNFSQDLYDVIGGHHQPWEDIPRGSLTGLIKVSDVIVHASGFEGGKETASYKRIYQPILEQAWEFLGVSAKDQRQLVQDAARDFDSEYQLYESWGRQ